jgi:hypothetical protein
MSLKDALVIKYTDNFTKSTEQEAEYIEKNFGKRGKDWDLIEMKQISKGFKIYDKVIIRLIPSGKKYALFFDTTELYNKAQGGGN